MDNCIRPLFIVVIFLFCEGKFVIFEGLFAETFVPWARAAATVFAYLAFTGITAHTEKSIEEREIKFKSSGDV